MGQQQDDAQCSSQAGTTAHSQQGQGKQGWEWCLWTLASGLSIIQGEEMQKRHEKRQQEMDMAVEGGTTSLGAAVGL